MFGCVYDSPVKFNTMDFINIASTGNATDFGDLTSARHAPSGVSNAHGGL